MNPPGPIATNGSSLRVVLPVNVEALQTDHAKHRSLDLGENPRVLGGIRQALCASSAVPLFAT